jgi:5-keto-L-gluconate epimerase
VERIKFAFTVATPESEDLSICALRGDLKGNLQLLSRLGYHGVELMVRDPSRLDPTHIREVAADFNLEIPAVSTGQLRKEDGLQLCSLNQELRTRTVSRIKEVIDFAAQVGAKQINIGTVRGHLSTGDDRSLCLSVAKESLNHLLDYANERKLGIGIEPQNRFIINWLNSIDEALEWIRGFSQTNLSILFDMYHALFEEQSLYASLIRARPYISHVQISDTNRLAPGRGQFNFADFVRVLRALDYHGFISVEMMIKPDGEQAATLAAHHMLPLLKET